MGFAVYRAGMAHILVDRLGIVETELGTMELAVCADTFGSSLAMADKRATPVACEAPSPLGTWVPTSAAEVQPGGEPGPPPHQGGVRP